MGLVTRLMAYAPDHDFWYTDNPGRKSLAGVIVTPENSMCLSTVWSCCRIISELLASIPLHIYERLSDTERRKADGYYLYDVLARQPNRQQTSIAFRSTMTRYALIRGNAYAEIIPGRRGFADQLVPIHPSRVTVEQQINGVWQSGMTLQNTPIRYKVRRQDGTEDKLTDDEVFHLTGMSEDGIRGMDLSVQARDSFGIAKATEEYAGRFFSQNADPGGVLEHPGKVSKDAQDRLKETWEEAHSGLANSHRIAVLEEGMKYHQLGMSAEDAQLLESRAYQVADVCRWFGVPLHMVQMESKDTSWGSGIEEMWSGFVTGTLMPWAVRWEQAISRDLIMDTTRYYAEHLFDALLKGKLKDRYEAYAIARNWGWLNADDIRQRENMNALPDGRGQVYLQPLNMVEAGTPPPQPAPVPPPQEPPARNSAHYMMLVHEAAARIARKEAAAMGKAAKRCIGDMEAWHSAIDEFYADHWEYVAQSLQVSQGQARWYATQQAETLKLIEIDTVADWENHSLRRLLALAGGEQCLTN